MHAHAAAVTAATGLLGLEAVAAAAAETAEAAACCSQVLHQRLQALAQMKQQAMLQLQLVLLSCACALLHLRLVLVASASLLLLVLLLLHPGVLVQLLLTPKLRQLRLRPRKQQVLHSHHQQHCCGAASLPVLHRHQLLQCCPPHTSSQSMKCLIPLLPMLLLLLLLLWRWQPQQPSASLLLLGCTLSRTPAWLPLAAAPSQPSQLCSVALPQPAPAAPGALGR
jgi:hypothetical protein